LQLYKKNLADKKNEYELSSHEKALYQAIKEELGEEDNETAQD
jgi:hypothetical protein